MWKHPNISPLRTKICNTCEGSALTLKENWIKVNMRHVRLNKLAKICPVYLQKHLLDFTCQFCTSFTDEADLRWHSFDRSDYKFRPEKHNLPLSKEIKEDSSELQEEPVIIYLWVQAGRAGRHCSFMEANQFVNIFLLLILFLSIVLQQQNKCNAGWGLCRVSLKDCCLNCWKCYFPPTCVSSPGTERLLVPIERPVLVDPSCRSRVDKYSL